MIVIDKPITKKKLKDIAVGSFGNLVKAVVDISKQVIALDASLHADLEAELLSGGSNQGDVWGINLYPDMDGEDFVEFGAK